MAIKESKSLTSSGRVEHNDFYKVCDKKKSLRDVFTMSAYHIYFN